PLRVSTPIKRRNLNGGIVDFGKRRNRKLPVCNHADQQQTNHQQRCRYRTENKYSRGAHEAPGAAVCAVRLAGARGSTCEPACSLSCPSTTTASPGAIPLAIELTLFCVSETATGRTSTVLSGLTVNTNVPCGPRCTATAGITVLFLCTSSNSRTFTNWFGQRILSLLSKTAFSRPVPVN